MFGSPSLLCFGFGALKIRDRTQTIPFKVIPKASRGPQHRGSLTEDVLFSFFGGPYCLGGGGGGGLKMKEGATLKRSSEPFEPDIGSFELREPIVP